MGLAGAAAAAGAAIGTGRKPEASAQSNPSFVGARLGNFSRSDGQMIVTLITVDDNGTLVTSSSDHLAGSTSHGTWVSLGNNQFAYSQVRMNVDPSGNYSGIRTIDADVTIDSSGDAWTSTTKINFYDVNGTFLQSITSAGTGVRIPLYRITDTRPQGFSLSTAGQ
jgi:hypothetical protein